MLIHPTLLWLHVFILCPTPKFRANNTQKVQSLLDFQFSMAAVFSGARGRPTLTQ